MFSLFHIIQICKLVTFSLGSAQLESDAAGFSLFSRGEQMAVGIEPFAVLVFFSLLPPNFMKGCVTSKAD